MKMRSNYQDIKTMDELNGAIHRNRARIEAKSGDVGESFGQLQAFYTPQNLALQGVRKAAFNINFYTTALTLVRALKRQINKKK